MSEKYTEEIVYQWQKAWAKQNLADLVESCKFDTVALPYFLKYLPKEGKVLECGCGPGQWIIYLNGLGYQMSGIEIVPDCVEVCRKFFPGADISVGDVRKMPFPERHFKGYISIGVVEHMIEGPDSTLREMKRVLQPDGIVILTVPAFNYFLRAWGPLRRKGVDLVRYNPFIRKIMGKPIFSGDLQQSRRDLRALEKRLHPDFWPVVSVDPEKGPLFIEYKCAKGQIEEKIRALGFEIVEAVPIFHPYVFHDVFGDLFFSKNKSGPGGEPRLSLAGRALAHVFNWISPHFFNYIYMYVAKLKP